MRLAVGIRIYRLIILLLLLQCGIFTAAIGDEVSLTDRINRSLSFELLYLEDPKGSLSFDEIRAREHEFTVSDTHSPNFGFTQSVYWFQLNIPSGVEKEQQWLMEIAYPLLDDVTFYRSDESGRFESVSGGDTLPFSQREVPTRNTSFLVNIPDRQQSTVLYLRVQSASSLQVPLRFWPASNFTTSMQTEYLLFGLYYGALFALLAYNLMLIMWIRDVVYLYYASHLATFALFQLSLTGLAYKYLWPESVFLAEYGLLAFMSTSAFFSVLFTQSLLQIKSVLPQHRAAMTAIANLFLVTLPAALFFDYQLIIKSLTVLVLASAAYFVVLGFLALKAGVTTARFFLLAWFSFLAGVVVYALKTQGVLPNTLFTEHAIQVGSAMEAVLLSFALAHRFKVIREEATAIQIHAKETLEQRVEERTRELKVVLEELTVSNARLEGLNNTDQLTGINNRTFFDSHIEYVWNNTARANEFLAILMVDVDNFKSINDNYGHLIGDEVLIAIAKTIKKSLTRSTDQVARFGGEEFVVVLPSTHSQGAAIVAERIRKSVESIRTLEFGLGSEVTVSIGISCVLPATTTDELRDVIEQADKALYQAKENGRNRVEIHSNNHPGAVLDFATAASATRT